MSRVREWPKAPTHPPQLASGDVDVWSVRLDCSPAYVAVLLHALSGDECERADRFHFERDRRRFICARGTLRRLLAAYLDVEESELTFAVRPEREARPVRPLCSRTHLQRVPFRRAGARGDRPRRRDGG